MDWEGIAFVVFLVFLVFHIIMLKDYSNKIKQTCELNGGKYFGGSVYFIMIPDNLTTKTKYNDACVINDVVYKIVETNGFFTLERVGVWVGD